MMWKLQGLSLHFSTADHVLIYNVSRKCAATNEIVQRCNGCQDIAYCSRACQKYDWRHGHRNHCLQLQREDKEKGKHIITFCLKSNPVDYTSNQKTPSQDSTVKSTTL